MTILHFTKQLLSDGRIVLESERAPAEHELEASLTTLIEHELLWRETLAGTVPKWDGDVGRWAIGNFYRIVQLIVYQHLEFERPANPVFEMNISTCYSVDLVFRFLPNLMLQAIRLQASEEILGVLADWAQRWPLSSVGIPNAVPSKWTEFLDDPCLAMLYLDRIIAYNDFARLSDGRVNEFARCALGAYPELSPPLAEALGLKDSAHS